MEGFLILVGVMYLAAPVVLGFVIAVQARKRRELAEEVQRLSVRLDALGRRVATAPAAGPAAEAGARAAEPVLDTVAAPSAAAGDAPTPPAPVPPPPAPGWSAPVPPPEPSPLPGWGAASPPPLEPTPAADASPPAPVPPPLPPPAARPPAAPRRPAIDWESFVGVRLFSWVAGVALLVAGVSFIRYSLEHGWLGPTARAAIGAVVGLGLLVGAETRRARRYAITAQALAAAGVALLFANVYAAHALWGLLPTWATFPMLVLIAAVAVTYSIRRASLAMALLGLAGGFAIPLLLSTGEDRPIGLFSYLLLLNAGLAWVGHKRRWPLLSALSLGLTALYQLGWVGRFLGPENTWIGALVFLLFPAFGFASFALSRRAAGDAPADPIARWTAALGAVPAALFAVHLAGRAEALGQPGLAVAFAVLLAAGLLVVAAAQGPEWLHLLGAGAAVAALWARAGSLRTEAAAWPVVPAVLALAAVVLAGPRLVARLGRPLRAEGRFGIFAAPLLLVALTLVVDRLPHATGPLAVVAASLLLVAAIAWTAVRDERAPLLLVTAPLAALDGLMVARFARGGHAVAGLIDAVGLGAIGLGALLADRKLRGRTDPGPLFTAGAAALLVAGQLATVMTGDAHGLPFLAYLVVQLALLCGLLAVAARTGRHAVSVVAALTATLGAAALEGGRTGAVRMIAVAVPALAIQLAAAYVAIRRGAARLPLWAAALASGLTLVVLRLALIELDQQLGVGPAALLQAAALVPHLRLLLRRPGGLAAERSRIVVAAGTILALVTAAIPLELENEWITVGLALLAPALAWLHRRVPHRGLLAWIAGLAVAVGVRLAVNPEVLRYHERSGTIGWNFWLYAYGVPALALLAAAWLLPRGEDRLLPAAPGLRPMLSALGAVLLFLLLNVEIADAFSEGAWVELRLSGGLAYDLALTIGWAVFAIGVLAAGVLLRSRPARVAAIALLAVTVLKGFLLDLSRLSGLYRVASFVGLAVSLALVAVVLQRFVLSDRAPAPEESP